MDECGCLAQCLKDQSFFKKINAYEMFQTLLFSAFIHFSFILSGKDVVFGKNPALDFCLEAVFISLKPALYNLNILFRNRALGNSSFKKGADLKIVPLLCHNFLLSQY